MTALIIAVAFAAYGAIAYGIGREVGRAEGRYEAAEQAALESAPGVDDMVRGLPPDLTDQFIDDFDRRLRDEEWRQIDNREGS